MAVTLTVQGAGERVVRELKNGVYRIGRETPADVLIADPTVSATHAEIQVSGDVCTVRDLGSTNGTWINSAAVRSATVVKPSDELRFGSVVVTIEPAQPSVAQPSAPAAGKATARMAAAQRAAGRLNWWTRYVIAAAEALLCFLLLVIIIIAYNEAGSTGERRLFRFRDFAAQYVHLLSLTTTSVPAPSLDESLQEPILVLDGDGKIVYPQTAPGQERVSPVIDKKTSRVYDGARLDLYKLPDVSANGGRVYSYPVRRDGELVGFVVASPRDSGSPVLSLILTILIAGALAGIVLYFASRPITNLVRTEIGNLTDRVPALAGGLTEELPRSVIMPELQPLVQEIERAITRQVSERAANQQTGGNKNRAYLDRLADLVDTASIAFCVVDSDYVLAHMNDELRRFREFSSASIGSSLFAGGLSTVQARDLVQAMNAGTSEPFHIDLRHDGEQHRFAVFTRTFQADGRRFYGLLFTVAGE